MTAFPPEKTPDLLVERLLAGELSETQAKAVRDRLASEDGGELRLEALRTSNEEILAAYPADDMVARIEQRAANQARIDAARADEKARGGAGWLTWGAPVAMAALVAVFMLRAGPGAIDPGAQVTDTDRSVAQSPGIDDFNRAKGLQAHVQVFRKQGDDAERLRDGGAASEGDVLQLRYVAGDATYGVIVSIDGRGELTRHYPEQDDGSTALRAGKAIALPHAYELDDAPEFERFIMVSSDKQVDMQLILDAARNIAGSGAAAHKTQLDLPAGYQQFSFVVRKVQP